MNPINYSYQAGNIVVPKPNEDHVSALLFIGTVVPSGWAVDGTTQYSEVRKYRTYQDAVDDGIDGTGTTKLPHYHIKEFFRIVGTGELYVFFSTSPATDNYISYVQTQADGRIRQMAIHTLETYKSAPYLATLAVYKTDCNALAAQVRDTFVYVQADATGLGTGSYYKAYLLVSPYIGLIVAEDGANVGRALTATLGYTVGAIGAILGATANAQVHINMGWVEKFNLSEGGGLELDSPAFVDSVLVKDNEPLWNDYDTLARNITLVKYVGATGTYVRNDYNCMPVTDDLNSVKRVRTFSKVKRLAQDALLPKVNSPIYTNPANGYISAASIAALEELVMSSLQTNMLNKGELTAAKCTIDPNQNILATNTLNVLIEMVPVGCAESINVTLSYVLNI